MSGAGSSAWSKDANERAKWMGNFAPISFAANAATAAKWPEDAKRQERDRWRHGASQSLFAAAIWLRSVLRLLHKLRSSRSSERDRARAKANGRTGESAVAGKLAHRSGDR